MQKGTLETRQDLMKTDDLSEFNFMMEEGCEAGLKAVVKMVSERVEQSWTTALMASIQGVIFGTVAMAINHGSERVKLLAFMFLIGNVMLIVEELICIRKSAKMAKEISFMDAEWSESKLINMMNEIRTANFTTKLLIFGSMVVMALNAIF